MAQKLRDDKIGTLSHSAGNIQMLASSSAPAYLTIGGQQYKITSSLIVALPAMSANTRYQVFAVQSGGVVSLVISQNENSVGPAGYTRWKLVGSLMANPSGAFGAFVEIKGKPRFSQNAVIEYTPVFTNITASPIEFFNWSLDGEFAVILGRYTKTAGVGATCSISLPANLVVSSRVINQVCVGQHAFATASSSDGGIAVNGGGTVMFPTFSGGAFAGKLVSVVGTVPGNNPYSVDARIPIQGFSNTAIEDR